MHAKWLSIMGKQNNNVLNYVYAITLEITPQELIRHQCIDNFL